MKQYCHVHPKIELVRLYINPNQARKLKADYTTNIFYCIKCKEPIRIEQSIIPTRKQITSGKFGKKRKEV